MTCWNTERFGRAELLEGAFPELFSGRQKGMKGGEFVIARAPEEEQLSKTNKTRAAPSSWRERSPSVPDFALSSEPAHLNNFISLQHDETSDD